MKLNFSDIEVAVVDPIDSSRQKLLEILSTIEGVRTVELTTAKEILNHLFFIKSEIVLLSLKLSDADGFVTAKKIKELYPKTVIIALVTFMDSRIEMELKSHGISGYIGLPIVEVGRTRYRIFSYVNHIRAGNHTEKLTASQSALNPFCQEIRSVKTTISIANEEEMMDFGLWLIERYTTQNRIQGIKFSRSLDLLYGTISYAIKQNTTTSVLIEESFDALFVCVPLHKMLKHQSVANRFESTIGENIKITESHLFLRIWMTEESDEHHESGLFIDESTKVMLRKSHIDKLSAIDYVISLSKVDLDEVRDLDEVENSLEEYINFLKHNFGLGTLKSVGVQVSRYAVKINKLHEFSTLGYALSSLGLLLSSLKEEQLSSIDGLKIHLLLFSVYEDIAKWRNTIFYEKSTKDVHYLDSSLLSSCMQIEAIVMNIEVDGSHRDDELELF